MEHILDELDQVYNNLIDDGYFTEEELNLLTCINGYNMETLNDAIYARFGLRNYESLREEAYE